MWVETKYEWLITTKAELLNKKFEKWKEDNMTEDDYIEMIIPFMSYAGDKGYMIGCQICWCKVHDADSEAVNPYIYDDQFPWDVQ